jgi:hypothetical protein
VEKENFILRQLLQNERLRLGATIAGCVAATAMAALVILSPMAPTLVRTPTLGALLCIAMTLFGILALWLAFVYRFFFTSSARRLPKCLAHYGDSQKVIEEIDTELRTDAKRFVLGQPTYRLGSPQPDCLILTANWLLRLCPGGSVVFRVRDAVWVYKRIIMRSAPLTQGRMDFQLGCRMRDGAEWTFDTWTDGKTDQVLRELLERRPELLTGYRGEWLDLFEAGEAARNAELQTRRDKVDAMSSEERELWLDASWDDCQRFPYRIDRQAATANSA